MTQQDTENQIGGAGTTEEEVKANDAIPGALEADPAGLPDSATIGGGNDTIEATVAGDQVGVDENGNDVLLKDGETVIVDKSDITDGGEGEQSQA